MIFIYSLMPHRLSSIIAGLFFLLKSYNLPVEQATKLKTDISSYKRLPDLKFVRIIERYLVIQLPHAGE
jgi:hypothetical protein